MCCLVATALCRRASASNNCTGTPRHSEAATTFVSVRLAFSSCLAVGHLSGGGDSRLPFADVSLPFERYARPFGDYATFDSSHEAHDRRHLRLRLPCRYAFWPGFPQRFACC